VTFKWATDRLAKDRIGDRQPDERDLEETYAFGRSELRRVIFALPEERLFGEFEKAGMVLTDLEKQE
jgi:DNA-binding FadR family transcriptional regulator